MQERAHDAPGIDRRPHHGPDDEQDRLREHDSDDERLRRIDAIESELNQCWDFLRQRRAKAAAGQDFDRGKVRDPETVDTYLT
jgi:hypothetical protein